VNVIDNLTCATSRDGKITTLLRSAAAFNFTNIQKNSLIKMQCHYDDSE